MPNYNISVSFDQGLKKVIIHLKGVPEFGEWEEIVAQSEKLLTEGYDDWELNLTELPMCNSIGLGMIVTLNTLVRARSGFFSIRAAQDSIPSRLLTLTRLDNIVSVHRQ
jgi:anti-anti-sigma regulatory factor